MALDSLLLAALGALEPYLGDIVVVGGWVPHIYAQVEMPQNDAIALRTRDIDIAVPRIMPERGRPISEVLGAAGFECEFRSRATPPVTAYVGKRGGGDIEIEFLTTAQGAEEGVRSVGGVTATELRYIDIPLANRWGIPLEMLTDGGLRGQVFVPTPSAFIVHKLLAHKRRLDRSKRPNLPASMRC